jgi:MFS family permease
VGTALFGGGTASGLQARYAAIDGADAVHRGRSLSLVVWATTIGSVAGPNLSGAGATLGTAVGVPPLAGPYLFSLAAFALAAAGVALWLRPDPLLAATAERLDAERLDAERLDAERLDAEERAAGPRAVARAADDGTDGRVVAVPGELRAAVRAVGAVPGARLGLAAVGTAHAVMVSVMVMTPVYLHGGGASLEIVGVVISLHIAGMYALSPVVGALSDRFGRVPVIWLGLAVLGAALILAGTAAPTDHTRLAVGLTLLGVGWSACVVAGSTLLSESVGAPVRTSVQGLSDLVMGLSAAGAGALAGPVLDGAGYSWLTVAAATLLVPVLILTAVPRRSEP